MTSRLYPRQADVIPRLLPNTHLQLAPPRAHFPLENTEVGEDGDSAAAAANTADTMVPRLAGGAGGGSRDTPTGNGGGSSSILPSVAATHDARRFISLNSCAQGGVCASPAARPTSALRHRGCCCFRVCGLLYPHVMFTKKHMTTSGVSAS